MRLAICGIRHETNTFSALRAGIEDFHVLRGNEILADGPWQAFDNVEWAPTLVARAQPHGLVLRDTYESMAAELVDRLRRASPVDGVYLDLHGAMEVEGLGDGERDLVCRVRETVGGAMSDRRQSGPARQSRARGRGEDQCADGAEDRTPRGPDRDTKCARSDTWSDA